MPNLTVVQSQDDLDKCLAVRRDVFIREKGVPEEIEIDAFDTLRPDCLHFLILQNEKPVGTLRCRILSPDRVKLQRFCLLKEFRGKGIGEAAMEQIADFCRKEGFRVMELDAKYEAGAFYEKCGCRAVSGIFIEANVPHIRMEKALTE